MFIKKISIYFLTGILLTTNLSLNANNKRRNFYINSISNNQTNGNNFIKTTPEDSLLISSVCILISSLNLFYT